MASEEIDKIKIEHEIQLLVEGNDARNFFKAFVTHLELEGVQIQNFGGVHELRGFLAAFVNAPGFGEVASIGVVRDAENVPGGRVQTNAETPAARAFRSVRDSLVQVALPAPRHPAEPAGEHPTVRALIIPGDGDSGMLETLLCRTFVNTAVDGCIDDFLRCAAESGQPVRRPDKARAHAWIATKPDPHVSVGVAALKGYWDFDHDALGGIRQFLTSL